MRKKIILFCIVIILCIITIFFLQINYKNLNIGNNISTKTSSQIVDSILNMKSYTAKINLKIISNKNEHTYVIEQRNKVGENYSQEIIEPSNIRGTIINYDGQNLRLENTRFNLSKIYENYPYLIENEIVLDSFLNDYKNNDDSKFTENMDEIVLSTDSKIGSIYNNYKSLIIDKKTGKPLRLEIKDVTQNTLVYILYNEIEINSL